MTSIPPCSADSSAASNRHASLRNFMRRYDIRLPDVAEQMAAASRQANQAVETFSPQRVHGMLYRNAFMPRHLRDHLINLGFPENTLPPETPVARFPGLVQGSDSHSSMDARP